jgi:hypothetical protein
MVAILESVRRCRFCGSDMTDSVPPLAYRENPFCVGCLPQRLSEAKERLGPTMTRVVGNYTQVIPLTQKSPSGA